MTKKIAIIGGGPVSLFEALYQHKIGNSVTVFEKGKKLGGAWGVINYGDYELEIGCHIWDVDKATYRFIERFLEDELEVLKPHPSVIIKNKKIPYDWKNNLIVIKSIKHDFKAFLSGKRFAKPLLKPRKYKYPKRGSNQLISKLLGMISETNIKVNYNTLITDISYSEEGNTIVSLEDKKIAFDGVIITTFSSINKIYDKNVIIKKSSFNHYHLIIDGELDKRISYVRLMNHDFIHRVSDITAFSDSKKPILTVGVFKHKLHNLNEEEIIEKILKELKRLKWIKANAKIHQFYSNEYNISKLDHNQIKVFNGLKNIKVLRSTNFIHSIGNNIDRWSILLND